MKFDVELVIFDMDGTILDTLEDLKDALNYSLARHGYEERTYEEVRRFVGNGIRKLIERALPDNAAEEEIERVFETLTPYYQLHCKDKTKPYDGIVELVQTLKDRGFRTAVVSNKLDAAVQELCDQYFAGLFDCAVGERTGIRKKPAADSVVAVMEKLGTKKAVYVGDSEVDIATAKNAGLDCILVTWGFRDREFLMEQGGKYFVDSAQEVLELFAIK